MAETSLVSAAEQERFDRWNEVGHVIDPLQHDLDWFDEEIFPLAQRYRDEIHNFDLSSQETFAGRIAITNFQEPSTRTELSSVNAALRLGFRVISVPGNSFSSIAKGESIEDMMHMFERNKPWLSIIRFSDTGAAALAADIITTPVINAGDGKGHHPTQADLDWFTLKDKLGELRGREYVFGGDARRGRTIRSLATKFAQLGDVKLTFITRPDFTIDDDLRAVLEGKVEVEERVIEQEGNFVIPSEMLEGAAAAYWTRTQLERVGTADGSPESRIEAELAMKYDDEMNPNGVQNMLKRSVRVIADELISLTKPKPSPWQNPELIIGATTMRDLRSDTLIMHPMPRIGEVSTEIDADPRAIFMEQAGNGTPVRKALIHDGQNQRFPSAA